MSTYIVCWTDRVNGVFVDAWEVCESREDAQSKYDFLISQNENLYTASICTPVQSTDYGV